MAATNHNAAGVSAEPAFPTVALSASSNHIHSITHTQYILLYILLLCCCYNLARDASTPPTASHTARISRNTCAILCLNRCVDVFSHENLLSIPNLIKCGPAMSDHIVNSQPFI